MLLYNLYWLFYLHYKHLFYLNFYNKFGLQLLLFLLNQKNLYTILYFHTTFHLD